MSGLGRYIRAQRQSLGLQQNHLAATAQIPQAALSDIERGRIALPNADIRRRLAAALHVRHVDLLVAAGELAADECDPSPEPDVNDPVRRLLPALYAVKWDADRITNVTDLMRSFQKVDQMKQAERTPITLMAPE